MDSTRTSGRYLYSALGLAIAAALVVALRDVLLVVMAGVILGVVLSYPVRLLSHGMPRGLAVILSLLLCGVALAAVAYLGYQPVSDQVQQFDQNAPAAIHKAKRWLHRAEAKASAGQVTDATSRQGGTLPPGAVPAAGSALAKGAKILGSSVEIISGVVIMIVLAAFFAHDPTVYRDAIKTLVPRSAEEAFDATREKLEIGLKHWVKGILISMTIMGTVTAVGLWIAGIQAWPLLGCLTFLGTFVPYVGAIASAVPGLLLGLAQSGSKFIAALCVYIGVHMVEGYLVQPFVMKRAVVIQPALLLIWQLIMATLCGLLGVIVATPLLVCVQIITGEVYIRRRLGKSPKAIGEINAA